MRERVLLAGGARLASDETDDFGNKRFHNAEWLSSNGPVRATT